MARHPATTAGGLAVITGAASGIGLAAAAQFARLGMRVLLVDVDEARLAAAADQVAAAAPEGRDAVDTFVADVSRRAELGRLATHVGTLPGGADVVMANAGIQPGSRLFGGEDTWRAVIDVNLWGVIDTCRMLVPGMIAGGKPGLVIVTGSKQGITTPPGDPAYNVAKAGVKAFAEALEHELRSTTEGRVSARLLIPGFVFTPLTARGRVEKPAGAWTPEETIAFMMERLEAGDFYILCPDGETTRELDRRRIAWAAGDVIDNRPPLSRWHPDHAEAFKASLADLAGS
ncbi:SDR family NAD(P)-dependent oxidoreductase [Siculibacillus lacustris]|uniref:SDR family NAD(P)-dependent oxidoreductase n=1 Tax=Siculibacillus lacustris TaxID=1549641 RepID=A0A4V2KSQ4_9HYPH|nr:SDR family NAD(P)-dependent oxidoreductase [Siculibacillus lacustris]TBW33874.1 SDR family NAD(P)-dependent oxidoreductase [Siculibacillus lacustris]